MPSFKGDKLRVNLRLCINRLKLLEKKKTEQALKARKEIADYIKAGRIERAKIRVEHIIREDYLVEAMEVIELYCDLLLARFGMLEVMQYCEESLIESVSTLIWVAPRLLADIQELSVVEKQLENKFGKEFALQARSNMTRTVNQKVIHRLGVESPKKSLVENYMIEIARNYKVEYTPDTSALLDDDFLPDTCPSGDDKPFFPTGGGMGGGDTHYDHYMPDPVHYPPQQAGPLPSKMPPMQPAPPYTETAPTGNSHMPEPHLPQLPIVPPPSNGLDLPPVPNTTFPGGSSTASDVGGDVDFDDLTRRFEELKNRK